MKPIFGLKSLGKGFVGEGSTRVSKGRSFKGSVELNNRFLSISSHLDAISILPNLFWGGSYGTYFLLECSLSLCT